MIIEMACQNVLATKSSIYAADRLLLFTASLAGPSS